MVIESWSSPSFPSLATGQPCRTQVVRRWIQRRTCIDYETVVYRSSGSCGNSRGSCRVRHQPHHPERSRTSGRLGVLVCFRTGATTDARRSDANRERLGDRRLVHFGTSIRPLCCCDLEAVQEMKEPDRPTGGAANGSQPSRSEFPTVDLEPGQ
jgi:hypothetical protein